MLETSATGLMLVLVCLEWKYNYTYMYVNTSHSRYMTQTSAIPFLSPVPFIHVADPYVPLFKYI